MFYIIWLEIKELFCRNLKIFILSILAFTCACAAINVSLTNSEFAYLEHKSASESYGDNVFYKIILPGEEDVYQRMFDESNFENLKSAFEQLKASKTFQYRYTAENAIDFFDITNNAFGINDFPKYKNEFLTGYLDGTAEFRDDYLSLQAFYADNLFHKEPNVSLSAGSWFQESDFFVTTPDGIELPVMLGSSYQNLYQIGEKMKYAHLGTEDNITLNVIAFFNEDSYFYDNNNNRTTLNRYMVVPSIEILYDYVLANGSYAPLARSSYDSFKLVNTRIICKEEEKQKMLHEVQKILNENGLYEFRLFDETGGWRQQLEANRAAVITSSGISAFIICLIFIIFCVQIYYKIVKNKKKYTILLMLGIKKMQLLTIIVLETFFVFLLSLLLFAVLYQVFYTNPKIDFGLNAYTFVVIPLIEVILLIIMGIFGSGKVYKLNLSSALREKE